MEDSYFRVQEEVYNALLAKHDDDPNFCFSLRKNFNKDTYRNYFTGTEKSNYFTFSLWYVKNSYPGASIDPIVYKVVKRDGYWVIEMQLHHTKTPDDEQNRLVLELLILIRDLISSSNLSQDYDIITGRAENRMFKLIVRPKNDKTLESELIQKLLLLIEDTKSFVNDALSQIKREYPGFNGEAITPELLQQMIEDRKERTARVKNSIPSFTEVAEEVMALNDLEENSLFQFQKVFRTYVWIGDQSGQIGNLRAHYELKLEKNKKGVRALVHFEDKDASLIKSLIGDNLPHDVEWYNWSQGEGIQIGKVDAIDDPNTPNELFKKLNRFENELGTQIREVIKSISGSDMKIEHSQNVILYGPPGTGKTFNTINHALSIVEGKSLTSLKNENRVDVIKRYQGYKDSGLIDFVTFHQSYSYEDFVEGIRPNLEVEGEAANGDIAYKLIPGVFREISESADSYLEMKSEATDEFHIDPKILEGKSFHKVSLGNTQDDSGSIIYEYCKENNCIAIGWGEDVDYTGVQTRKDIIERYKSSGFDVTKMDFNINAIERLITWFKKGDIVFVSHGTKFLKAVGIVQGDYEYRNSKDLPFHGYNHFRKVKWLITDANIPVKQVYYANFSQQSIYSMWSNKIKKEFFTKKKTIVDKKNHVLIIDEINRGNVSAIFGELITLIEADKRKGAENEMSIKLPYSKTDFSVPTNLYIIGTMNTADRSVEALDTALRRRFTFKEMLPDPSIIAKDGMAKASNGVIHFGTENEVDLVNLLEVINDRIEVLIDRDHTIGHAYFMDVDSKVKLKHAFENKIIPLLQEYFYGDYRKMEMVIGSYFFDQNKLKRSDDIFAKTTNFINVETGVYQLKQFDSDDFDIIDAVLVLLNKPKKSEVSQLVDDASNN